jgi:glycine/D-amino acid oxidase-like deaminating enzyme
MKYLAGLARAVTQRGGRLFSDTVVESATEEKDGVVVKTDRGTVRATDVVFATNSPIGGSTTIHTKQAPYRTYALVSVRKHFESFESFVI